MQTEEVKLLIKLLKSATKYEQVVTAKAKYPAAIAQAARLLDRAEVARLKAMKDRHEQNTAIASDADLEAIRRLLCDRFPSISREDFARSAQANMFTLRSRLNFVDAIRETSLYEGTSFPRRCLLLRWFEEEYQIFMESYKKYG